VCVRVRVRVCVRYLLYVKAFDKLNFRFLHAGVMQVSTCVCVCVLILSVMSTY
jgi:hypothetical protein